MNHSIVIPFYDDLQGAVASVLANSTSRMLFDTTIPTIMTTLGIGPETASCDK